LEVYESGLEADNSRLVETIAGLLGAERAGLVTDVDGTISPIVARPDEARVLPAARDALAQLRELIALVAVVSGRRVADARAMVGLEGIEYVGNHGLEVWGPNGPEVVPGARPWVPRLAQVLDDLALRITRDDILIENKGVTASVHYRTARNPEQARAELLDSLAQPGLLRGFLLEEGSMVLNLLPPITVTKGTAVDELVRQHGLQRMVYLGDDVTDAHAFRALKALRAARQLQTLTVRVLGPDTPQPGALLADACIASVPAVAEMLCAVVGRLRAGDTMAAGVAAVRSRSRSRRKANGQ
jgi:trehalose 6-phosphate phosphatase